jgi:hypothetical protein
LDRVDVEGLAQLAHLNRHFYFGEPAGSVGRMKPIFSGSFSSLFQSVRRMIAKPVVA